MGRLSVAAAASVVTAGLAVGCGGGADEPPTTITEEDLPMMVLQREDIPAGLNLLDEDGKTRGFVEPLYNPSAEAMFLREFELPPDEAESGTVVCITNSVVLYETPEEAKRAFREVQDLQKVFETELKESETEVPWIEIDSSSLPPLGDEHQALRFVAPGTDFCSSYEDEPAEAYFLVTLRYNVGAGLMVWTYERGASLDEAIELAQMQASRMEAVFEGDALP